MTTLVISSKPPSLQSEWREILESKYLLKRLIWRDLKVRYNNTILGVFWNVIQPLVLMVIFVVFLGLFFKNNTHGVPVSIYTYSALCLWHFFSRAFTQGGNALANFQGLVSKVYFPRLIAPISLVCGAAVDFVVAFALLILLQLYYGACPLKQFVVVPFIFLGVFTFCLGLAFFFSALSAKFRDFTHVIPLLSQLWIFATPIMYPYSIVSPKYLWFYNLNPMVGYVEAFRWAVTLSSPFPSMSCVVCSLGGTIFMLMLGIWCFRRFSGTLVDTL